MKILLVDDDSSIIQAVLPLLRADGHDVRVATTGAKALEHVREWAGLEVLLTDVVMDPMDGFTLNGEVRALAPAVRTIFITGYDLSDYAEQTEGHTVLAKPLDAEALRAALASGVSVAAPVVEAAEAVAEGELAPGQQVGAYQIVRKIADGRRSTLFEAIQTAMKRRVALRVLQPALQRDEQAKIQFIADARARAGVQHPHILSVYEAGEIAGATFYAQEHVAGDHLAALAARGETISEPTALKAVRTVAEALAHFSTGHIPHAPLGADSIFLSEDTRTRVANLATADGQLPEMADEMKALADAVLGVLPGGQAEDAGFQAMLQRMRLPKQAAFPSWPALLQTVKTLEPRVIPADAGKIREKEIAAIRAVDMAKKRQKRTLIFTIITFFILVWIIGGAVWWKFFHGNGKVFNTMLEIPAGEFIYQSGEKVALPTFWIDQYEVTMAQYQQFLDALAANLTTQYDHPKQPPGKSHVPKEWDIYWNRANAFSKSKRMVKYVAIDVNCPVFNVDWWDAYAYAKWKGHRLPTEQEWEKAARGTDGRQFPWGNEWDPTKCNNSKDYAAKAGPNTTAAVDGYVWWSPVDAITGDKSPYGVMGMAGNVIEWTDSWEENHTLPVLRGGSFASPDCLITRRSAKLDPEGISESVGFRTVSDTPPAAK